MCEKAIDDFSNAIHYGSDTFKKILPIHFFRGEEYTKVKEYGKAIEDFSESLRLIPDHIKALLMRGNAYFGLGEKDKAKADFDEYLNRKRKNTDTAIRKEISELFGAKPEDISLEIIK
jgi:tetratricopeptide (TPR) repeat protein